MRKILLLFFISYYVVMVYGQNIQTTRMMYGDSSRIGQPYTKDPFVVNFKGRYLMYYTIPAAKDQSIGWGIGIAESSNLMNWKKIGELNPLSSDSHEYRGICAPCAIIRDGKVHLFYQTYGNGSADAICHAYSLDGVHFERNRTNPVFRPTGDWNCGRAIDAEVFNYKGKYYLYFATRDKAYKRQLLGVAVTSANSTFDRGSWKQACSAPILEPVLPWEGNCVEAPSIIKRNGKLYMFYAGNYNNSPQQIGVAESEDGLTWRRCFTEPFVPCGQKDEWNSSESGHPGIFDDKKRSYLFFQGNNTNGKTWLLSNIEVLWNKKLPYLVMN